MTNTDQQTSGALVARVLRALGAVVVLCGCLSAQRGAATPAEEVERLLQQPCERWADVPVLHDALVAIGPGALPALFEAYATNRVSHETLGTIGLGRMRELAVAGALERLPRESLRQFLGGLSASGSEEERRAGLRLLERAATTQDLSLLARLAAPADDSQALLEEQWRRAVDTLLAREQDATRPFGRSLGKLPVRLLPAAIRALGDLGTRNAFDALVDALGDVEEVDALVLVEILNGVQQGHRPNDWGLAKLTSSVPFTTPECRSLLAHAFAVLKDPRTVPELLQLLEDGEATSAPAREALSAIAVLNLPADPLAWGEWYDREQAWYGSSWTACLLDLGSDDPTLVAGAIRVLAAHPLFTDEIAEELVAVLRREEPALVVLTCSALAQLRARGTEAHLLPLLEHEHEGIRSAAAKALREITGLQLLEDPGEWHRQLERRR